ncbi:putative periplasmic lipoprotein [Sulfurospirillum multivorans]|uniref:Membrane lipoprotein n=2 Tax=Sulfurospirillum multivorans TaxID=66821 RepID=A0AA86ALU3_SULMK|nr:hypothetical protein [Sulfurospirillum multivorans]AHJ13086.1 putative membrane lipoprotein [Sulfurospirillum multivorans DSM 12446]QEH06574.1 putative membrane lipoprotein [Sulfurospirillum multivorans]
MKSLFMLFAIALLLTGCTTKVTRVYTPNETVPAKEVQANASESDVGYAAGQAAGAAVFAGAYVLTLPIRIVENIAK